MIRGVSRMTPFDVVRVFRDRELFLSLTHTHTHHHTLFLYALKILLCDFSELFGCVVQYSPNRQPSDNRPMRSNTRLIFLTNINQKKKRERINSVNKRTNVEEKIRIKCDVVLVIFVSLEMRCMLRRSTR